MFRRRCAQETAVYPKGMAQAGVRRQGLVFFLLLGLTGSRAAAVPAVHRPHALPRPSRRADGPRGRRRGHERRPPRLRHSLSVGISRLGHGRRGSAGPCCAAECRTVICRCSALQHSPSIRAGGRSRPPSPARRTAGGGRGLLLAPPCRIVRQVPRACRVRVGRPGSTRPAARWSVGDEVYSGPELRTRRREFRLGRAVGVSRTHTISDRTRSPSPAAGRPNTSPSPS